MRLLSRLLAIAVSIATRILGCAAVGQCLGFATCVTAAVVLASTGEAFAATVNDLDATDPMTWLVKSVCYNQDQKLVPADPYGGCPPGDGIRKIRSGDPLPFHNIEQEGYQQRDSFPVINPIDGKTWIIAAYDYSPFNIFNLYNATDGYDVYNLQNGWVSAVNTSDGGGYGQTFFGANCTVGGAWVFFPTSGFLTDGSKAFPINDKYWEQRSQNYPGNCPTSNNYYDTQNSWHYVENFQFGGHNGNPIKTMNTIISTHGFPGDPSDSELTNFLQNGHLEVFYFTREYGITRWEVWTPEKQNPTQTEDCVVPGPEKYQDVTFVVQYCHDWSATTTAPTSTPALPVWPIPNINLLGNPHFSVRNIVPGQPPLYPWEQTGNISVFPEVSDSCRDQGGTWNIPSDNSEPECVNRTWPGIAYLQIACGSGAGCNDFTNGLYQAYTFPENTDISASQFPTSGTTYGLGINVRTDKDTPTSGSIGIQVKQFDGTGGMGNVLSTASTTASVTFDNGTPGKMSLNEADSVYLSSAFVCMTIPLAPGTKSIRFLISPQTPQVKFDVVNAWFAPYPVAGPWPSGLTPCNPVWGIIASGFPLDRPWYLVYPRLDAPLGELFPFGLP